MSMRRARRMPWWLAVLGIVLFSIEHATTLVLWNSGEGSAADSAWVEDDAGKAWERVGFEEIVTLHHLDRVMWLRDGLDGRGDGAASRWQAFLRWYLGGGMGNLTFEEDALGLVAELREGYHLSPNGLAALAVVAERCGDRELAGMILVELEETTEDSAWLPVVKAMVGAEAGPTALRELATHQVAAVIDALSREAGDPPRWWEAEMAEAMLAAGHAGEELSAIAGASGATREKWLGRFSWNTAANLVFLGCCVACIPIVFRTRPFTRHPLGSSRVVRAWGQMNMWGWFAWISLAAAVFAGILGEFSVDEDWQFPLWQIFLLIATLWAWRLWSGPGLRLAGVRPWRQAWCGKTIAVVCGAYGLMSVFYFLYHALLPGTSIADLVDTTEEAQMVGGDGVRLAIFFSTLTGVILAPVVEEILHRGVVHQGLRARFGVGFSIMVSSAVFGVLHVYSFEGLLSVAVAGVFFAWVYERTRSLWPAIWLHALGNGLITIDQWMLWGPP